ncbi:hypothetical protein [Nonomuraea sp. CA-141351]|uniref:hypothetical protein n=1 Tax=Nonomuraea sp. CA-141351 TaxID=3239996 RepID=UPI003D950993
MHRSEGRERGAQLGLDAVRRREQYAALDDYQHQEALTRFGGGNASPGRHRSRVS